MKKLILGLAAAASMVTATAVVTVPTAADAQPRYWHGVARGHAYDTWRHGYYGRYHRYPARSCTIRHHRRVCYYR